MATITSYKGYTIKVYGNGEVYVLRNGQFLFAANCLEKAIRIIDIE